MIADGELAYMREFEPEHLVDWLDSLGRNVALWIANLDRATVVEVDGRAAGYEMWRADELSATLITINVLPEFRRRGLGTTLLKQFVADAQACGRTDVRLGVHRANPARHLYERAGFTATGEHGEYLLFRRP